MSQKFTQLKFHIVEGNIFSNMFGLVDTGAGSNLVNMEYHQLVVERHTNLEVKFSYLKDLDDMDPFNISGVNEKK